MEEKYTFPDLNLKLIADYRYYGEENHLWISFQSCSPYERVVSLEDLDGTGFKDTYVKSILKFCKGRHFSYKVCYPNSKYASNAIDIVILNDANIDLERFTNEVNNLLGIQYQYLSKQNLIRRKEANSSDIGVEINNDVLKRGVSGFDSELKNFGQFEMQSDNEHDLDWIKIPTNVRAVKLSPDSILIYFGRYARADRTGTDELRYVELSYEEASAELEMLASKKKSVTATSPKKTSSKAKTSKSKKSKSKEVDHDN